MEDRSSTGFLFGGSTRKGATVHARYGVDYIWCVVRGCNYRWSYHYMAVRRFIRSLGGKAGL